MDLYMVVRHPCCGRALGAIVESDGEELVQSEGSISTCWYCKTVHPPMRLLRLFGENVRVFFPKGWLKKIPPLGELDETTDDRKLPAEIA